MPTISKWGWLMGRSSLRPCAPAAPVAIVGVTSPIMELGMTTPMGARMKSAWLMEMRMAFSPVAPRLAQEWQFLPQLGHDLRPDLRADAPAHAVNHCDDHLPLRDGILHRDGSMDPALRQGALHGGPGSRRSGGAGGRAHHE